jgi:hypothetical protein
VMREPSVCLFYSSYTRVFVFWGLLVLDVKRAFSKLSVLGIGGGPFARRIVVFDRFSMANVGTARDMLDGREDGRESKMGRSGVC